MKSERTFDRKVGCESGIKSTYIHNQEMVECHPKVIDSDGRLPKQCESRAVICMTMTQFTPFFCPHEESNSRPHGYFSVFRPLGGGGLACVCSLWLLSLLSFHQHAGRLTAFPGPASQRARRIARYWSCMSARGLLGLPAGAVAHDSMTGHGWRCRTVC